MGNYTGKQFYVFWMDSLGESSLELEFRLVHSAASNLQASYCRRAVHHLLRGSRNQNTSARGPRISTNFAHAWLQSLRAGWVFFDGMSFDILSWEPGKQALGGNRVRRIGDGLLFCPNL